jgi:hypothetical protein
MRARCLAALVAFLAMLGTAYAGPKQDIQNKIKEAMESYDGMDYDAAKKVLGQAFSIAKKSKLDKDPVVAKAHLSMGIIAFANGEPDIAKDSFAAAVKIDPKIQIDPAYKSAEMAKVLEQARSEAGSGGGSSSGGSSGGGDTVDMSGGEEDCGTVQGVQHKIIDSGKAGAAQKIDAYVGADVEATKIALLYRPEGATEFTEVKLKKEGDCKYTGTIPGSAMKGTLVHYFVGAFNDNGKQIAGKGSEGSPNIIELTAGGGGGGGDGEDPIGGGGGGGGDVVDGGGAGVKKQKVMILIAGGTGIGYISGQTEGENMVKNAGFGASLLVLQPELGFFVKPQMSIGVALRMGIPVGANVEGHATAAPGGLARVRYALKPSGEGLRFMGQLGIGVTRNTITLDNSMPGMDTDIVAQGPLLLGGGAGFAKKLSGSVSFVADVSLLLGLHAFSNTLSPAFNSGFGFDFSLGLQLGI